MNRLPRKTERQGGIDPAALAAATLSAAVTVISPAGPYSPTGTLIGITVLAVVLGFDHEPIRYRSESAAYSAVFALILWLSIAYPIEVIFSGINGIGDLKGLDAIRARLSVLVSENSISAARPEGDIGYSTIPPLVQIGAWTVAALTMYEFDQRRSRKNIENSRESVDESTPTPDRR